MSNVHVAMTFSGAVTEVPVTNAEAVRLLNGKAVAFPADEVEPFVDGNQTGVRILRPEVER